MTDFHLGNVTVLHGLWLLPLVAFLMLYAARRRSQALRRLVDPALLVRLGRESTADPARRVLRSLLVLGALGCLVVALARPSWDRVEEEVTQSGRDVVFLLDVSRSMLAEDLPPNRLERAKLAILDAVERLSGDRVALAVFAGSTVVKCPLTQDYGFFRMALDDVTPHSVSRGGTLIGDALRTVLRDVFDAKRSNYRDIILITDGEDHESFPVEAASAVGEQEIRLIAIGLGDERVGQRIPVRPDGDFGVPDPAAARSFLRHEGREVWSRLDADALRSMVAATPGGLYLNVATGAVDLGEVYRRLVASSPGRETGSSTVERLEERFQLFLALCLLLLALETGLREVRRRTSAAGAALVFLLVSAAVVPSSQAASIRSMVNEGNDAFREERYEDALRSYEDALEQDPDSAHALLNRANALYRKGDFGEAAEGYSRAVRRSLEQDDPQVQASGLHNLGNALYRQAEQVAQGNPGQAIDLLAPAARSYLDALRADPTRMESARNLEMARRFIRLLREKSSPQQQSGGQEDSSQSDQQDRQQQLQQAAERQRELADESEQLDQDMQQNRGPDSRERQEQRAEDLKDRQQELGQQTENLRNEAEGQQRQHLDDARRHQQEAQSELERDRPAEARDAQQQAAEALQRAAAEQGGQEQEAPEQEDQTAAGGMQPQEGAEEDLDTAMDQILAKEQSDRRRRNLDRRVGAAAVDKDW